MKILFYSYDVANFLLQADVKVSKEREIISNIYKSVRIGEKVSEQTFANRVRMLYLTQKEYEEMSDFFQGIAVPPQFHNSEDDLVEFYFKHIYLDLYFNENCRFRKLKLRSLLRMFGYRRRTVHLVNLIEKTLKKLKIKTFLRGNETCSISHITLDDMIIFKKVDSTPRSISVLDGGTL